MMRGVVFPSSAWLKGLWDGLTGKAFDRDFFGESKGPSCICFSGPERDGALEGLTDWHGTVVSRELLSTRLVCLW